MQRGMVNDDRITDFCRMRTIKVMTTYKRLGSAVNRMFSAYQQVASLFFIFTAPHDLLHSLILQYRLAPTPHTICCYQSAKFNSLIHLLQTQAANFLLIDTAFVIADLVNSQGKLLVSEFRFLIMKMALYCMFYSLGFVKWPLALTSPEILRFNFRTLLFPEACYFLVTEKYLACSTTFCLLLFIRATSS